MKSLRIEKFKSLSLAALLIASATFVACSSDDNIIEEQPVQSTEKVYTMTIQATKATGDDATTRGLYWGDADKKVLNVNWMGTEKVRVVQNGNVIGTLSAAMSSNASTTLTGTVVGFDRTKATGFYLLADENGKMDYTGQKGNIMEENGTGNIEENYDFASYVLTGPQTMEAFTTTDGTTIVPKDGTYIPFTSQQAIVRFELQNSSGEDLFTTNFIVTDNQSGKLVQSYDALTGTKTHGNITITPSGTSTSNVYYAALNFDAASDIELRAFDSNGDLYTYKKENVTFTKGKYYRVKVKMEVCKTKKLSQITPDDTYIVGWHVAQGTVGEAYAYDSEKISFPSDKTYAIIAYVGNVPGYFNKFLAIGMNDIRRDGTDGSENMMWSEALTAANNYAGKHSVVIGSTTYNTSPNGSDAYDRVEYHVKYNNTDPEPDTYPTNTATGNARQGWRLPTITDWRYVFEGLKGSPSATSPVGVKSGNGIYADNNAALLSKLNSLLSTDAQLRDNVYWTSSDEADNYAWFFSFLSSGTKGFFYLPKTNSYYVRPVFAY